MLYAILEERGLTALRTRLDSTIGDIHHHDLKDVKYPRVYLTKYSACATLESWARGLDEECRAEFRSN